MTIDQDKASSSYLPDNPILGNTAIGQTPRNQFRTFGCRFLFHIHHIAGVTVHYMVIIVGNFKRPEFFFFLIFLTETIGKKCHAVLDIGFQIIHTAGVGIIQFRFKIYPFIKHFPAIEVKCLGAIDQRSSLRHISK